MKDKCFIPMSYLFLEINKMFINNVKIELEKIGINPTYRYIFHNILIVFLKFVEVKQIDK